MKSTVHQIQVGDTVLYPPNSKALIVDTTASWTKFMKVITGQSLSDLICTLTGVELKVLMCLGNVCHLNSNKVRIDIPLVMHTSKLKQSAVYKSLTNLYNKGFILKQEGRFCTINPHYIFHGTESKRLIACTAWNELYNKEHHNAYPQT
ncbi:MAG: hypothetical protein ACRCZI_07505 [Cetobacterium sp.]